MKKNVGWSLVLGLMALAGLQSCQLVAGAIEVAREVKDFLWKSSCMTVRCWQGRPGCPMEVPGM